MSAELSIRELTAPGRGAVSVLLVRGREAAGLLEELTRARAPRPGELRLVRLRESGVELDEALLVAHAADEFELHLHGSPPLVRRLLARGAPDVEAARLSVEQRAEALLAGARTEACARMLLDQAEGALRRELAALAGASADRRRAALAELAEGARIARWLVEPARVVIAGPVNAGKSTLFNVLLGEGRAIVSAEAGTTRDVLREPARFGAYPVWLHDTAGERALDSTHAALELEREGQRRAQRLQADADLVLWLEPEPEAGRAPPPSTERTLCFQSRASPDALGRESALAALEQPELARTRVAQSFHGHLDLPEEPWQPGAAVPFTHALARALSGLDPYADRRTWEARIEALLAATP